MLRLIGLHAGPYTAKDCSVCIRAIKLFNLSQSIWKDLCLPLSIPYRYPVGVEIKLHDETLSELSTGGYTHVALLRVLMEKSLEPAVREKVLVRMQTHTAADARILAANEAVVELSYRYFEAKKALPDWNALVPSGPGKNAS